MARRDRLAVLFVMMVFLQIIRAPALKTDCPIHLCGSSTGTPGEEETRPGAAGQGARTANKSSALSAPTMFAKQYRQTVTFYYHIIILSHRVS